VKNVRRPGERQRSEDAERLAGKGDGEKVPGDDMNARRASCRLFAKPSGPDRVGLDRDHPQRTTDKGARQRTRTGAYLDDKLARSERCLIDDLVGSGRIKKVLPELAPSPVSVCPPPGGHGRTPWSSWTAS
jgi:hypothetical protein